MPLQARQWDGEEQSSCPGNGLTDRFQASPRLRLGCALPRVLTALSYVSKPALRTGTRCALLRVALAAAGPDSELRVPFFLDSHFERNAQGRTDMQASPCKNTRRASMRWQSSYPGLLVLWLAPAALHPGKPQATPSKVSCVSRMHSTTVRRSAAARLDPSPDAHSRYLLTTVEPINVSMKMRLALSRCAEALRAQVLRRRDTDQANQLVQDSG